MHSVTPLPRSQPNRQPGCQPGSELRGKPHGMLRGKAHGTLRGKVHGTLRSKARWAAVATGAAALTIVSFALVRTTVAAGPGHDHVVFSTPLANVPGKTLTAVVVNYAPGGTSPSHQHAGSVFAYVLSGSIRSENSATGPVKVYHTGEAFFEPPGSIHKVSENASQTEPASLLAIFVADDQAQLTKPAP